jgi:tetratricopeptide (TPR) repeat protein
MPSRIFENKAIQTRSITKAAGKAKTKKSELVDKPVGSVAAKIGAIISGPDQASSFEKAMEQFHGRSFAEAMQNFQAAASGPSQDIAHAARLHRRMCEQRLGQLDHVPKSSEDHYNLAVALINRRDLTPARAHLLTALELTPEAGHLHYAMALLSGLEEDFAASACSLARAIQLEPSNRAAARKDPDFHDILRRPELRAVLEPQGVPTA